MWADASIRSLQGDEKTLQVCVDQCASKENLHASTLPPLYNDNNGNNTYPTIWRSSSFLLSMLFLNMTEALQWSAPQGLGIT